MKGKLFQVIRGSTEDGRGLRTVVYLSGCGLDCAWCQNPEGKSLKKNMLFYAHKCCQCGACEFVCIKRCHRFDNKSHIYLRENCDACGACAKVCPKSALVCVQNEMESEALLQLLLRDKSFYDNSGGGVTFSGGECVLQNDFLLEMLKLCKSNGIHTAIETALFYDYDLLERILPHVDCVLADIKHIDSEKHRAYTGHGNELILENFQRLAKSKVSVIARCAVIPQFNDTEKELFDIAEFVKQSGVVTLELLNFNDTIANKYAACGLKLKSHFGKAFSEREFEEKTAVIWRSLPQKTK